MGLQYNYHSTPAIQATAIVVDLRNFTPNLGAAHVDVDGVNDFCAFLAEFHAICLDACRVTVPLSKQDDPPFLLWSTGDGVIVCFTDPVFHVQHGYLAALIMQGVLRHVCKDYNQSRKTSDIPTIDFGIGMETGEVWGVCAERPQGGPKVRTYLGPCINVAARAQEVTKTLHRARTIIGTVSNQRLVTELLDTDYGALVHSTKRRVDDEHHTALEAEMSELNRQLCLGFIHVHTLRGVDAPIALFRLSESTARLGNPRFESLLARLTSGSQEHLDQVREFLSMGA